MVQAYAGRRNDHGHGQRIRWLAVARQAIGTDGGALTAVQAPSVGLPHPLNQRPGRHGCHFVCAAYRLPIECFEWRRHLLQQFGALTLSGMGGCRRVRRSLDAGAAQCDSITGDRLVVAGIGWRDDQGSPGRGKKQVPIPRIAARAASNAACSLTATAFRWPWSSMAPTGTT